MNDKEIWQEMLSGRDYQASHPFLIKRLTETRTKVRAYNEIDPLDAPALKAALHDLLGDCGEHIQINQPFRIDYGCNLRVGDYFFANFNFTVLDEGPVTIGAHAYIGPNVSIYTAVHPIDPVERNKDIESSRPVTIGDNVWIGGNVTIVPGVTIGDNVTIGAGSVVTRNIPSDTVAAGNPARVIRHIRDLK